MIDIRAKRPGFHVYKHEGDFVLIDVNSAQLVLIDEVLYSVLSYVEDGLPLEQALVVAQHQGDLPEESLLAVERDIEALRSRFGFFQPEPSEQDDWAAFQDQLEAHSPRSMMLLVSQACNLRCTYCYEVTSGWHKAGALMSVESARATVDQFFDRSGSRRALTITFFGGEALLNMEAIRAVVDHARQRATEAGKQVSFTLTTNGTLLNDDVIEFLVENEFGVMLSLDGDQEAHDRYRKDLGGRGTHAAVTEQARKLLKRQLEAGVRPLKLRATLTKESDDYDKVADYLVSNFPGARVDVGSSVVAAASSSEADITMGPVEMAERDKKNDEDVRQALRDAIEGRPWPSWSGLPGGLRELYEAAHRGGQPRAAIPKICGLGRNMRAVTPDGGVYPCHRFVGLEKYKLQDGGDDEGERRRMSQLYSEINGVFESKCTQCWARFRCAGGGCAWSTADPDKGLLPKEESTCRAIRRGWELKVWLYLRLAADSPLEFERRVGKVAQDHVEECSVI